MRLVSLIAVLVLVAVTSAVPFDDISNPEWQAFKLEHRKNYSDETEEGFRLRIFNENRYKISKHNQLYEAGKVSYKMGLNKYSDMLHHEIVQTMNGYKSTQKKLISANESEFTGTIFEMSEHVQLPKSVDWRRKGAVTPVKDQGHCGSCWAFSTTGSLEGQHYRKTGTLKSLSEQNLIDCSIKNGNYGCEGGNMDYAFYYIKHNGGIDTEKSYPYEAVDDSCHFHRKSVGATVKGHVDIPKGNENKLKQAVAKVGPISVAIDSSIYSFQSYSSGVYDEPDCSPLDIDHGMLVVGYGTEKGQDYWLVKNSWGTSWGENGYIKMSRNKNNQCGIATMASYPLV